MQYARFIIPLVVTLVALVTLAACGGDSPDPTPATSLATPTAASEPEPTPTSESTVTLSQEDIENAVEQAIEEEGTEVAAGDVDDLVDDVVRQLEGDSGLSIESLQEIIDESLAALESASDGESEEDDESEPDVLFRYMNAVNTLYAGQNEESIPAFDLIIRIHPEMPRAYYYRGVAFYRSELNDQAIADFEKSIELDPESGDTYLQRGLLHYDTGNKQAALDDFNTAIDLAPWLADAYRNRGSLLINNGQAAPGRADLERALEIYLFERSQERVEEVRELLNNPPAGEIELFKATDILPRLP